MTCNCEAILNSKLDGQRIATTCFIVGNKVKIYPRIGLENAETGSPEKRKGKPQVIKPNFCPFCGEKYDADASNDEVAA